MMSILVKYWNLESKIENFGSNSLSPYWSFVDALTFHLDKPSRRRGVEIAESGREKGEREKYDI